MMSLLVVMRVMALIITSVSSLAGNIESQELGVAMQEMESANYFTFVMLINMDPFDPRLQNNITFLMPNDRMLSKVMLPQHSVTDFLLRHSIPSALPLEYLEAMPTGSTIPSSKPDYILRLRVSNDNNNSNGINGGTGSYDLFLNNVKIISPNICRGAAGSSIRCHGIDGVLAPLIPPVPPAAVNNNSTCSKPTPQPDPISSSLNPTPVSSSASPPTPTPTPTPTNTNNNNNVEVDVAPTAPTKSAASSLFLSHGGLFRISFTCAILLCINFLSSI